MYKMYPRIQAFEKNLHRYQLEYALKILSTGKCTLTLYNRQQKNRNFRVNIEDVSHCSDREAQRLKQKVDDLDEGSIQRRRTAWTTSVGHTRVTPKELRKRSGLVHSLSKLFNDVIFLKNCKKRILKTSSVITLAYKALRT